MKRQLTLYMTVGNIGLGKSVLGKSIRDNNRTVIIDNDELKKYFGEWNENFDK